MIIVTSTNYKACNLNGMTVTATMLVYLCDVICIFKTHDDMKMELDCQNLDSEFGLFGYKQEQKASPDRPGWFNLPLVFCCLL